MEKSSDECTKFTIVGTHFFDVGSRKAVHDVYLYVRLIKTEDYGSFLKRLHLEHKLKEKAIRYGLKGPFDIDVTIVEKSAKKVIDVDNPDAWTHACGLMFQDTEDFELHRKYVMINVTCKDCSLITMGGGRGAAF